MRCNVLLNSYTNYWWGEHARVLGREGVIVHYPIIAGLTRYNPLWHCKTLAKHLFHSVENGRKFHENLSYRAKLGCFTFRFWMIYYLFGSMFLIFRLSALLRRFISFHAKTDECAGFGRSNDI